MAFAYLAVHDAACIAACVYCVAHDSPWWAGLFALFLTATTVNSSVQNNQRHSR